MKQGVEMQKNKKQFYITELNMGIDGLESYTDYSGPFTLIKARNIMEKLLKNPGQWVNPYVMAIRGPRHSNNYGHNTEFYSDREDR
jgi:hypothetical protein